MSGYPEPEGETEPLPEGEPETDPEVDPEHFLDDLTTDYTPIPESSDEEKIIWVSLFSVCMLLILVGDIFIIVVILKNKHLRQKVANIYLLSLIFARTLIGTFVVPTRITGTFSEHYLGSVACKLCHFSALGSSVTSVLSVVAVAVVKFIESEKSYLKIRYFEEAHDENTGISTVSLAVQTKQGPPKETPEQASLKNTYITIALLWLAGHIYGIRAAFVFDMVLVDQGSTYQWSCTKKSDNHAMKLAFLLMDFICLFIIPVCIILYCYIKVIHRNRFGILQRFVAWRHRRSFYNSRLETMRTSSMLVALILVFILCNMPIFLVQLVAEWSLVTFTLHNVSYLVSYSNAWISVLVYLYYRRDLRVAFKETCMSCRCWRRVFYEDTQSVKTVKVNAIPDKH